MTNTTKTSQPLALGSTEGLGPLVDVLARWEDQNGAMAGILESEWDEILDDVRTACVEQSPRHLRAKLLELRDTLALQKASYEREIALEVAAERERWEYAVREMLLAHDAGLALLGRTMQDQGVSSLPITAEAHAELDAIEALRAMCWPNVGAKPGATVLRCDSA